MPSTTALIPTYCWIDRLSLGNTTARIAANTALEVATATVVPVSSVRSGTGK